MFYRIESIPVVHIEEKEKVTEETSSGKRLLCRTCGHYITSSHAQREMDGKLTHVFTNPAGYVFRIACFSTAPGCTVTGEPTLEYTWFSGYQWSYALCGNCLEHLGWFYDSGNDSFYGLILNKLREEME
ncbi:MAG: cereblon family protein [Spirochaetes bacterium]|nr:cereblon family protein [Spirochaetota bacterium]